MVSRVDIISDIVNNTQTIVEKYINYDLNNYIMNDIEKLLNDDYLEESKTYEEKLFNAGCWGGGVWDLIYHYYDDYKPLLVLNYEERENNRCRLSPIYQDFPYEELNDLCEKGLEKINKLN